MHAVREALLANDVVALRAALCAGDSTDIDAVDADGYTALYYACMKPAVTCATVQALLDLGARVDACGDDGETPLYIAVFHRRLDVARLLQRCGADVNAANGALRETVLHLAARLGYAEVLQWLLMVPGACVNARNARRETPLYAAAKAGRHECVYVMPQQATQRCQLDALSDDGKDALYIASEKGYKHIVVLLKAAQACNSKSSGSSYAQALRDAKAEADAELRAHPLPLLSSEAIAARAQRDVAFARQLRQRTSLASADDATASAAMTVIDIAVPTPTLSVQDAMAGKPRGPCRSLDEVGYDAPPPVPAELQSRPPAQLPRIGGTSMVVGTGTELGGKPPVRIDVLPGETLTYAAPALSSRSNATA